MSNRVIFAFLFFLMSFQLASANALKTEDLRQWFFSSINNKDSALDFYDLMAEKTVSEPLPLAYKGASKTFYARYSWNPYKKWEQLKKGMAAINQAATKKPEDAEIRFIRLSISYYLPDFLGYGDHMEADKNQIIKCLRQDKAHKPEKVKQVMANFLLDTDLCNEKETRLLKEYT